METLDEPFKTWAQEIINKFLEKNQEITTPLLLDNLKTRLLNSLGDGIEKFKEEAIQKELIDSEFDRIDEIYKLLTTLIYENRRHALQDEPCISIVYFFKILEEWLIQTNSSNQFLSSINRHIFNKATKKNISKLPEEVETALRKEENTRGTFFGSYPSDDSDSDEENKAKNDGVNFEFRNLMANHLLRLIGDYLPTTSKGGLYKNADSLKHKPLPPRWVINPTNLNEGQYRDLLTLNALLKQGKSVEQATKEINTKFFVAQYRGISYSTSIWNKPSRKNHRDKITNNEVGEPQYSTSVYKASNAYPYAGFFSLSPRKRKEYSETLKNQSETIKQNLLNARKTRPVVYKDYVYNNKAHLMQEEYTKDYNKFHNNIEKIFNNELIKQENPFVSTGNVPKHALEYAYGTKFYKGNESNRLHPRWRNTGQAERPYAGKVYVSLHPVTQYDEKGPLDALILSRKREISPAVTNIILHERECSFPAVIEGEFVIAQHVAKFPSFKGDYKNIYLFKYGLTKQLYNLFKDAIIKSRPHTKERELYETLLRDWICVYHEVRLIDEARKEAEKSGGVLVYHNEDGSFGLEPDSPNKIGTMPGRDSASRKEIDDTAAFRKDLAKFLGLPLNNSNIHDIDEDTERHIRENHFLTKETPRYFDALFDALTGEKESGLELTRAFEDKLRFRPS